MTHPDTAIEITGLHDGAAVRMPADKTLIAAFRARFPKAFWGAGTRSWHVPGKLAARRLALWVAEQQAYLQALDRAALDAEWEAADPNRPAAPPSAIAAAPASPRAGTWMTLPSDWRRSHRPPAGEPEKAVAAVAALDERLGRRELFGFLKTHFRAWYDDLPWLEDEAGNFVRPQLHTAIHPDYLRRRGAVIHVHWCWSILTRGEGWAEYGWHPCGNFYAVTAPDLIWRAINPGKRIIW